MEQQKQTVVAPVVAATPPTLVEEQLNIDDNMKHCFENLIVIDVGANLTNKKYSRDLDSVVQRARDAGSYTYVFECPAELIERTESQTEKKTYKNNLPDKTNNKT